MKNILFYGDSNTWGFDPATTLRFPYHLRWTSVCAVRLGSEYNCIPAGMNGRTTVFDDPIKGSRNGIAGLDYELQTHKPLDLFVVMLGTNDLKYTNADGSAGGMERLIGLVLSADQRYNLSSPVFPDGCLPYGSMPSGLLGAPGTRRKNPVLLIAPILLGAPLGERGDAVAESAKLAERYRGIAERRGLHFLDAARWADPSGTDGVHLDAAGHRALGEAVAAKIREITAGAR